MSALKKLEEDYKKIVEASDLRVGFFVTISRKLTDKEIKTWPWGYQPCEKYIGCSRHILMNNGIGYTLNGIDLTFPIEMLTPTAVSTVPAPYLPPTKGVETFTGYQIITENDVHMCLSTGRVYQLYFNDKCQASEFLKDKKVEFLSNNHIMLIDGKPFFPEEIKEISSNGRGFVEYFADK